MVRIMTLSLVDGVYHVVATCWWCVSRICNLLVACIKTMSLIDCAYHDYVTCCHMMLEYICEDVAIYLYITTLSHVVDIYREDVTCYLRVL